MSYTIEDFKRDYVKEHFAKLSLDEQKEALRSLSGKQRLAIRAYLRELTAKGPEKRQPRKRKPD
ncbi:MAG: hypothetical protein U0793_09340 [Gemmataceae bacterium]